MVDPTTDEVAPVEGTNGRILQRKTKPTDDRIRRLTQKVLDEVWEFLQSEGECPNATPLCGRPSYCASYACGFCGMARAMEKLNVAKFEEKMRPK